MHDEPLPQCLQFHKDFADYKKDAEPFRSEVSKHSQQLITLEQAKMYQMETIDAIKEDIGAIRTTLSTLSSDMKVWVMGGFVATVALFSIPTFSLFYDAGQKSKQIEVNTKRLDNIDKFLSKFADLK